MGNADRIIRIVIAAVLGYLYFSGTLSGTLGIVALVVGIVFLLTSLVGYCGLYSIFGLRTCPAPKAEN